MSLFDTGANLPDLPNMDKWFDILRSNIDKFGQRGDERTAELDNRFNDIYGTLDQLVQQYAPEIGASLDFGKELRTIYKREALPMERQFVKDATNYDTVGRREQAAAEAGSDVTAAAEANRQRAAMELQRYGIDPSDPRYNMVASGADPATAAATAAAANNARTQVEDRGLALRRQAIDIGKSWDQQSGQWIGQGAQIGAGLAGAQQGVVTADAAVRGRPQDWYNAQVQTLQQLIDNQMQRYQAKMGRQGARDAAGSALGGSIGSLAGMGIGAVAGSYAGPGGTMAGAQLGASLGGSLGQQY